ncbi:sensor histidine kinase [Haliangium ochraceum]|uniref:histidine kinase n=1 Tax=Haliangium ochraceum (strain DSM 14365 / JCM 11303 / SMP-2) TaxID=502025 RepID=D0LUM3_HALO1|nr:ATP-binding protein [Haliangium ochraceum]ACY13913.1 integral membrane sensor signal transduction histidine kinase [Haliangium ochraceum DSM 14365]
MTKATTAQRSVRKGPIRRLREFLYFGSIRSKISFYLLLVSVVPILVLSFASFYNARQEIRGQLLEHLRGVVSLKSEAIERWYLDRRAQIQLLRETPDLREAARELLSGPFESRREGPEYRQIDRSLRLHTEHSAIYSEIFLMDTQGKIWYSSAPEAEGLVKSNRPYFIHGMKELFLQNTYYSLTLRRTTSTIALPLSAGGELIGVLAFRLNDERLGEIMAVYAGIETVGRMYLVNNYNHLVTSPEGRADYSVEQVSYSEPVQLCLARRNQTGEHVNLDGQPSAGEYTNHDGKQVLAAFHYLGDYRLCIVAEIDSEVAYRQVAGLRQFVIALTVVTLGVVMLIALWLSSSISRPVRKLTTMASVAASGNLDQQIHLALRDELGTLARSFNTMIASLKAHTDELTRINAELEEYGHIISHDLKEPLRTISGFMGLLGKKYGDRLDDRGRDYVDRAVAASVRMRQLIDDLRSYSRVAAQSQQPSAIALNVLVTDVLTNLTDAIETSDAHIECGELPEVYGVASLLATLVQNLIANAIKFRGDEPPSIHIAAEREGDAWRISVSDNGIGIDPSYSDRIYKMFQRLHPRSEYSGTGIGLAVCKKIVEYHHGRIWFESNPGGGTIFHFTIADRR